MVKKLGLGFNLTAMALLNGCGQKATQFSAQVQMQEFVVVSDPVDRFTQGTGSANPSLAVLWMVDNSSSMREEQATLASNFRIFIDGFIKQGVDLKMAVITTDDHINRDSAGKLTLQEAKLDEAGFKNHFAQVVQVGTNGDLVEKGLLSTQKFFEANPSWAGEDRYLIVIYISDEDDLSCPNADQTDPSCPFFVHPPVENPQNFNTAINYFLPKIQRGWPDHKFMIFSIVGGARESTHAQGRGNRYIELARRTGGASYEITKPFAHILKDLQNKVAQLIKFVLSHPAREDSIKVTVSGVEAPSTQWDYLPEFQEIKFKQGFAPPPNSQIVVSYKRKSVSEYALEFETREELIKEVLINGVEAPAGTWTYHIGTQSIHFKEGFVPVAGSKIKVVYDAY